MYDAVAGITEAVILKTEITGIALKSFHLIARHRVGDRLILIECRNIMVG